MVDQRNKNHSGNNDMETKKNVRTKIALRGLSVICGSPILHLSCRGHQGYISMPASATHWPRLYDSFEINSSVSFGFSFFYVVINEKCTTTRARLPLSLSLFLSLSLSLSLCMVIAQWFTPNWIPSVTHTGRGNGPQSDSVSKLFNSTFIY
jgi:hypothetical protein